MSNIILSNKGEEQKIILEEKEEWVYQVLIALGVAEEILVELNNDDIVSYLNSMDIEIFNNCGDESIDIFRKGKTVAQWKHPRLVLVKEGPGKYYYEIHLNEWSLPSQMSKKRT
jgi:hypothetical protein